MVNLFYPKDSFSIAGLYLLCDSIAFKDHTDSLMVTVVPAQHHLGEYSRDVDLAASSEGSIPRASHKTIGMGPASHPQAAGASCGGGEKGEMETEGSKREREKDTEQRQLLDSTLCLFYHIPPPHYIESKTLSAFETQGERN